MNSTITQRMGALAMLAFLITVPVPGAVFSWDAGGGAGNEGWSYQSGGIYVNWDGSRTVWPGIADLVSITLAATSIVDGDIPDISGGNSVVGATAAPGATLVVAAGKTLGIGITTARVLTIGNAAGAVGTVVVQGTLIQRGNTVVGGPFADTIGTLTVDGGTFKKVVAGTFQVGAAAPNTAGRLGPQGILNIRNGGHVLLNWGGDINIGSTAMTAGSTLVGRGILDLRDGTLSVTNGRSIYVGSTDNSNVGSVRGHGTIRRNGAEASRPLLRLRGPASFVADGDGGDRDLDLSDCSHLVDCLRENGTSETNGWYAIGKGRLRMPMSAAINSGADYLLGENTYTSGSALDYDPDLVNSLVCSNIVYTGTGLMIDGALLAVDRTGLSLPALANRTLAVWELTPSMVITRVGAMTFRYDYGRAAANRINETDLALWQDSGSGWSALTGATVDTTRKQVRVTGVSLPAGAVRFAIGRRALATGTVVVVR